MSSRLSSNSEASELLESLEDMFPRFDCIMIYFAGSTLQRIMSRYIRITYRCTNLNF